MKRATFLAILSSVEVPEINRSALARMLKHDQRTTHIPIIVLSAEQLTQLQQGRAIPDSLLQEQGQDGIPGPSNSKGFQMEDAFLQKVRALVDTHLDDARYGIDDLCKDLFLSRMQVHRKIKALTNKSTSLFVRSVRLQHAKRLLRATDRTISEIAYDTGFTAPNYFSRVFKEEFGVTPRKMRRNAIRC